MMTLDELVASGVAAVDDVKAVLLSVAGAAGSKITSWIKGDPADQMVTYTAEVVSKFTRQVKYVVRGRFLSLSVDPGDPDPITGLVDPLEEPGPGWLSALGEGEYGTPRVDKTFASGGVTLTNSSAVLYTIAGPDDITVQNSGTGKTYRNVADGITVYPVALAGSSSVTLPISADESGAASNAAPGDISILVSTLPGVTCSNASAVLGSDRESAASYRTKCTESAGATSPNGPEDAYNYVATTARDDDTFGNSSTGSPLSVNRTFVSKPSATGSVNVYFANASGGAAASADVNLGGSTGIDAMIKRNCVPAAVTYTGRLASDTTVAVTYHVWVLALPGLTAATVRAAIATALETFFESQCPLGGFDVVDGVGGTLYVETIESLIRTAHPAIYRASVSLPAGNVSLAIGACAVLGTILATVTGVS